MKLLIKKIFIISLIVVFLLNLLSCGGNNETKPISNSTQVSKKNIAISLPNKNNKRWNSDGSFLKQSFTNLGYDVSIIYSDNNISHQFRDLRELINSNFDMVIVAPIDKSALPQVIDTAKGKNIKIISYNDIINDTECLNYSIIYDDYLIGKMSAEYIEKKLNLQNNLSNKYNIEIFTGDSNDDRAKNRYDGVMSVLKKYLDDETINVLSGDIEFLDVSISNWNTATAMNRMQNILDTYYTDKKLDAVISLSDDLSAGIISAIDTSYNLSNKIIVTGEGANPSNLNYILDGKQSMTIYNSNEREREILVKVVDSIFKNVKSVDVINDPSFKYDFDVIDNNKIKIPTYMVNSMILEKDNVKNELGDTELYNISNGYFVEW